MALLRRSQLLQLIVVSTDSLRVVVGNRRQLLDLALVVLQLCHDGLSSRLGALLESQIPGNRKNAPSYKQKMKLAPNPWDNPNPPLPKHLAPSIRRQLRLGPGGQPSGREASGCYRGAGGSVSGLRPGFTQARPLIGPPTATLVRGRARQPLVSLRAPRHAHAPDQTTSLTNKTRRWWSTTPLQTPRAPSARHSDSPRLAQDASKSVGRRPTCRTRTVHA